MDCPSDIVDRFGLGAVRRCRRIEHGYISETWDVTTDSGRYAVRNRPPSHGDPNMVRAQHRLMLHLARMGFPVPRLVCGGSGETFVVEGDACYEIQTWIDGGHCDDRRPTHRAAAARTLAAYHCAVDGFDDPQLHQHVARYHPQRLALIAGELAMGTTPDVAPAFVSPVDRLVAHADDLHLRLVAFDQLPTLVIHGDYYGQNLLFKGDEVSGLVDYDQAHWAPRIVEVAEALIYFGREALGADSSPARFHHIVYDGWVDVTLAAQFLRTYLEVAPLTQRELRVLPDVMRLIWLSASLRPPLELPLSSGNREALNEVVALADWAHAHAAGIVTAAR